MRIDPVCMVESAGIEPDEWQARLLRSQASRLLLNCSRQSGKSTTTAALALHTAMCEANSLTLLLSPGLRQSQELLRKCLDIYRAPSRWAPPESESSLRFELETAPLILTFPTPTA